MQGRKTFALEMGDGPNFVDVLSMMSISYGCLDVKAVIFSIEQAVIASNLDFKSIL
jgi:hypothetical protein